MIENKKKTYLLATFKSYVSYKKCVVCP